MKKAEQFTRMVWIANLRLSLNISLLKFELFQVISECNNVCLSNNAIMQCLLFALEGDALEGDALEGDALDAGSSTSPSTAFAETLNLLRPAQQTVTVTCVN